MAHSRLTRITVREFHCITLIECITSTRFNLSRHSRSHLCEVTENTAATFSLQYFNIYILPILLGIFLHILHHQTSYKRINILPIIVRTTR